MISGNDLEIWALCDDKAGHKNQVLGVAESLNIPFTIKNLTYNDRASWPNFLRGSTLIGVDQQQSDKIDKPWPNIVIAAGRRTGPVAKYIKRKSDKKTHIIQLMSPGFPSGGFDLVAVPEHDDIEQKGKIITTIGSPHRITKDSLAQEAEMWQKTLGEAKSPCISLLVGGSTGKTEFTKEHAEQLGDMVCKLVNDLDGSLRVTNSRRTPDIVTKTLKEKLTCPTYFYDCNESRANPYFAFLSLCDAIIVTGDSISMCSESCAAGKPVYIYSPDDIIPEKHKKMHQSLYNKGYATKFEESELRNIKSMLSISVPLESNPLNTSEFIANEIKQRFLNS